MVRMWKLKLDRTLECFEDGLTSTISSLNDISKSKRLRRQKLIISYPVTHCILVSSPVDFLFRATSPPIHPQIAYGQGETFFQKYKSTLRRQIIGRTTLLDDVLATLENCARTIQQDLSHVIDGGDETRWVETLLYLAGVEL